MFYLLSDYIFLPAGLAPPFLYGPPGISFALSFCSVIFRARFLRSAVSSSEGLYDTL